MDSKEEKYINVKQFTLNTIKNANKDSRDIQNVILKRNMVLKRWKIYKSGTTYLEYNKKCK